MSEVATETGAESLETEGTNEVPEVSATPAFDEATWKRRLSGKDQALTQAQRDRDALKAQLDELTKWKAEREGADMSELDKAQKRAADAEARAIAAEAAANAARLARQYPLAAELLGEGLAKFSADEVAEIQGKLAAQESSSEEPEPRIDPNSPRKPVAQAPKGDLKSKMAALEALGNPFYDGS